MILIATADADLLARWEHALEALGSVVAVRQFDAMRHAIAGVMPRLSLLDLDLPGLEGPRGVASLRRTSPGTKLVVFAADVVDDVEIALFKLGVRGCTRRDVDPQVLKRMVAAIDVGELWIRRSITPRLLDELAARSRPLVDATTLDDQMALLTEREREIVRLIGGGESNKQIARELCITERTVKAHLTGIFRKLGVADRVRLALRVASRRDLQAERA